MLVKSIALTILIMLSVTGCSTMSTYSEPPSTKGSLQPIATIQNFTKRRGMFDWQSAVITSIDNKDKIYILSAKAPFRIIPGNHILVVTSSFNRSFLGNGPYQAILQLNAVLKSNHNYRVMADVNGAQIETWLVDESGQKVSSIASQTYNHLPTNVAPIIFIGH